MLQRILNWIHFESEKKGKVFEGMGTLQYYTASMMVMVVQQSKIQE